MVKSKQLIVNPAVFQFGTFPLNVVTDDQGLYWFNANEVCGALDFANPRTAVANHVDPDDVLQQDVIDSLGRTQQSNHVNESGLYALIFGSTKGEAKKFKRWVTSEVLPAIRKTGSYSQADKDQLRIEVEADYKENLRHHPNYELGTTLKNAIRCQDYDSTVELDKILDELDFAPAAKAQGASVASIRRQVAARISATHLLNSLHMGQHEHEDPVRDVVQWAQTLVREEDARAKMLAYQKERDKPKLTYQDLLAQDMATKHEKLVTTTPKKRVARKPK